MGVIQCRVSECPVLIAHCAVTLQYSSTQLLIMPTNSQLDKLKSALEAENSLSKSQLQEILEIGSRNTMRDTFKSCGLDTKKEKYTAEEIWQNFIPARQFIEGGKSYKDVAEHFGLKDSGGNQVKSTQAEGDEASTEVNGDAGLTDNLGLGVAEGVVKSVEESVDQILPFVPQLVVHTLKQKLNSPEMRTAINEEMSKQLSSERENNSRSSGTAFLLQKMKEKNQTQLTGTAQQEQNLLEASVENSNE